MRLRREIRAGQSSSDFLPIGKRRSHPRTQRAPRQFDKMSAPTYTLERVANSHYVQRIVVESGPDPTQNPIMAIRAAKPAFNSLLSSRHSFQAKIDILYETENTQKNQREEFWIRLNPVEVAAHFLRREADGLHTDWDALVRLVGAKIQARVDRSQEIASYRNFLYIKKILVYTVSGNTARVAADPIALGGKYVELPPDIKAKKAIINIKNRDHRCFQRCLMCWDFGLQKTRSEGQDLHAERTEHYDIRKRGRPSANEGLPKLKPCSFNFDMLPEDRPVSLACIEAFEAGNENVLVYVYERCEHEGLVWIRCLRAPKPQEIFADHKEVILFLHEGHYSLVKDFDKLMSEQGEAFEGRAKRRKKTDTVTCHRCRRHFNEDKYEEHKADGLCLLEAAPKPAKLPPMEGDKVPTWHFNQYKTRIRHPCVVYMDTETQCEADGRLSKCLSAGYRTIAHDGFRCPPKHAFWMSRDEHPLEKCLLNLLELAEEFRAQAKKFPKPPKGDPSATNCWICDEDLDDTAVIEHNHFDGSFRGMACGRCNKACKTPPTITILCHNLRGFDMHFIVKALERMVHLSPWREKTYLGQPLSAYELQPIASTKEKWLSLRFAGLRFIDSFQFVTKSLGSMIEEQRKSGLHTFPSMAAHHPYLSRMEERPCAMDLLLRKIPFAYSSMTGPEYFELPAVLPQGAYHDDLADEPCSDKKYLLVQQVASLMRFTSQAEWHDCYLATDVLALADCVEAVRQRLFKRFGIDMVHSVSLAGAAANFLLRFSRVRVDLICEANGGMELADDVAEGIRAGLSYAAQPFARARNAEADAVLEEAYGELPEAEDSWILYLDFTSLYPFAMTHKLPTGDYYKVDPGRYEELIETWTWDCDSGSLIMVDYHVPQELHDYVDLPPIAERSVKLAELSDYQRKLAQTFGFDAKTEKLVPDLGPQKRVLHHVCWLQYMVRKGLIKVTAVHKIWHFKHAYWARGYVETMASERAQTKSEVVKTCNKLAMNAPYGKLYENKTKHQNVRVQTKVDKFLDAVNKNGVADWTIYDHTEEGFLSMTAKHKGDGVVIDTPRIAGLCVLEISKFVVYQAYYDRLKPLFNGTFVYMDTDSIVVHVKGPDPFERLLADNSKGELWDLCKASPEKRFQKNKGKLGHCKLEKRVIAEWVNVGPKCYSHLDREADDESQRFKGVPGRAVRKHLRHKTYVDGLSNPELTRLSYRELRSSKHEVCRQEVAKRGLNFLNTKVYQETPWVARPLGHWRNGT